MPKSAIDPFAATNVEPVTAGRRAIAVTASAADLPHVTSSLIVTVGTTAGSITVVMADDLDNAGVTIAFPANSVTQLNMQARAITAIGATMAVTALYCN